MFIFIFKIREKKEFLEIYIIKNNDVRNGLKLVGVSKKSLFIILDFKIFI